MLPQEPGQRFPRAQGYILGKIPLEQHPELLGLMREHPDFAVDLKRRTAVLEEEKLVKQKALQDAREKRRIPAGYKPRKLCSISQ
jgi:hypothetical protein